ncbi:MAG TPA: hypothetical protein VF755_30375 [Catenuloplanes sp.]|jgi:hypothetical protein
MTAQGAPRESGTKAEPPSKRVPKHVPVGPPSTGPALLRLQAAAGNAAVAGLLVS